MTVTRRVFVSLGSNLGCRETFLRSAREALATLPGTRLVGASGLYETEPQDLSGQPPFLNQVICLDTSLEPAALLAAAQDAETAAGRERLVRFGPRTLDVDILMIEGVESDDPLLTLPHPRMWQRAFVLVPLADVWSLARGMPTVDVPALAEELARTQRVEAYGGTEAE